MRAAAIVRTFCIASFYMAFSPARYDVLGIGNAIVDVIARAEDDFLVKQGMRKGGMALIDEARAQAIYDAMGPAVEISGGSAANTIVGIASLGGRAAFVGKVKDDELGRAFAHDIRAAGVAFRHRRRSDGPSTGALLRAGDAGRRAHHEHVSRRRAGPASERYRRGMIAASAITLSRRLSVGSEARQGRLLKAAKIAHDAGAQGGADAVGCVLCRSLARRISAVDALEAPSI